MWSVTVPEILDAMHSWFTPHVLFLVLNLVIGTIAYTSALRNSNSNSNNNVYDEKTRSWRSPSVIVKMQAFTESTVVFEESRKEAVKQVDTRIEEGEEETAPETEQDLKMLGFEAKSDRDMSITRRSRKHRKVSAVIARSQSDIHQSASMRPRMLNRSETFDSSFNHYVIPSVHSTVHEEVEIDDELNAKADDFIKKFKQQLKLQRLEAIARYKE